MGLGKRYNRRLGKRYAGEEYYGVCWELGKRAGEVV